MIEKKEENKKPEEKIREERGLADRAERESVSSVGALPGGLHHVGRRQPCLIVSQKDNVLSGLQEFAQWRGTHGTL